MPDLAFSDRVVLEALAIQVAKQIGDDADRLGFRGLVEPEEGERREFERLPLQDGANLVVIADVASFYEYIEHDRLAQDVIELGTDVDLALAIRDALEEATGRQAGLPQGPRSSDVLADLYLSAVDRQIARSGMTVHRYNDDFLFGARDAEDARRQLVELERALRARGLALNNAKTRVVPRDVYENWINDLGDRLAGAELEVADVGFYGFDPDEFASVELGELSAEAVEAAFDQALDDSEPDPYSINDRLLERTLPLLAAARSTAALGRLDDLVNSWGSHLRNVSLYLRSFIGTDDEPEMVEAVGTVLLSHTDALSSWIRGWLLDPLSKCGRDLPEAVVARVRGWLVSPGEPWFLRGQAALVLAQRGMVLSQAETNAVFEQAPSQTRADLIAGIALAGPAWAEQFFRGVAKDPVLSRVPAVATGSPVDDTDDDYLPF